MRTRAAKTAAGVMVVAALGSLAKPVQAHGGIPRAAQIVFEPGAPEHVLYRAEFWGMFDSHDGGHTTSFICAEAFGQQSLNRTKAPTVMAAGGRILVASGFSGLFASDDGCNFRKLKVTDGAAIIDIVPGDTAGQRFYALVPIGADGGVQSHLYRSEDRGDSWTETSALPAGIALSSIGVSPSAPSTIYLIGVSPAPSNNYLVVSRDGGNSWSTRQILDDESFDPAKIVALDPSRPGSLLVRLDAADDLTTAASDRLLATNDDGMSFRVVYAAIGDLPGFAPSSDGKSYFVSGPAEGLLEGSLDEVFGSATRPFNRVFPGQVWGLASLGSKLYAGTDNYAPSPHSQLGVSSDDGRSFLPLARFCDVSFTCAPNTTVGSTCSDPWNESGGYLQDYLQGPLCTGDGGLPDSGGGGPPALGGVGGAAQGPGDSGASAPDANPPVARVHISTLGCGVSNFGAPRGFADVTSLLVAVAGVLGLRRRSAVRRSARARLEPLP